MENISKLENSSSILTVTLHENQLKKNGTYYARVSRNVASFKNLLSEIAEDNKGIDPYMLQYAAILFQKKILKMLEQGKAVNLFDLGTLYIALKCNAKGKSDVSESGDFYIKFSPTPLVNSALANLGVDKVIYADASPEITEINELSNEAVIGTVKKGKACSIKGSHLKISGEKSGIYFAPLNEDGKRDKDESQWKVINETEIFRNMPSELNFIVPQNFDDGKYQIIIRTSYLSNGKVRKILLESAGHSLTIAS